MISKRFLAQTCILALGYLVPIYSIAGGEDTSEVTRLFTTVEGDTAISLANGMVNSWNSGTCPSSNGWAGIPPNGSAALKATMLTAKAINASVTVGVDGCYTYSRYGWTWYKIVYIFLN